MEEEKIINKEEKKTRATKEPEKKNGRMNKKETKKG